jgi:prevent-host-death family protein
MAKREPVTRRVDAGEARERFARLVGEVAAGGARFLIEEGGAPVAAIVSPADLARLSEFEAERAERFGVLDEVGAAFDGVPDDELERAVAEAIAEVRAERWGTEPRRAAGGS